MTQQANPPLLKNIRIVMVNTSHPGNIGAAARALQLHASGLAEDISN
jgi:tRNA C32,U32 (ribose-2'-O)-methylase TrmJ